MGEDMWIVVNIGCIECGVSSNVVGVFTDKDEAERIAEELDGRMGWREGGQNAFEVFPMPMLNEIAEEYRSPGSSEGECAQESIPGSDMGKGE